MMEHTPSLERMNPKKRIYYKEYSNLKFDVRRTFIQIERWTESFNYKYSQLRETPSLI